MIVKLQSMRRFVPGSNNYNHIAGGGWLDVPADGDVLDAGHGGGPGLAHAAGLGQAGALPRPRLRVQQAGAARLSAVCGM